MNKVIYTTAIGICMLTTAAVKAATVTYIVEGEMQLMADPIYDIYHLDGAKYRIRYEIQDTGTYIATQDYTYWNLASAVEVEFWSRPGGYADIKDTFGSNGRATLYFYTNPVLYLPSINFGTYFHPQSKYSYMYGPGIVLPSTKVTSRQTSAPGIDFNDIVNVTTSMWDTKVSVYDPVARNSIRIYYNPTVTSVSSVPLPASLWLFGSGIVALGALARRRWAERIHT